MADGRRSKDVDDVGSGGDDDEGLEGEDLERALWLGTQRVRNRMRDADEAAGADGARGVVQTPRPARLLLLRAGAQACAGASRGVVETAEDGDRDPEHKRQKALVSGDSCEIPKGFNDAVVDDVSKSHGKNSEEVEIKMDLSVDLLHLVFSFLGQRFTQSTGDLQIMAICQQARGSLETFEA